MREYYKNAWGELWHGDCLEVMDLLEIVGPVADMVLCDPPYGTTACAWDSVVPFEKMWPRVWACSKQNAAVVMTAAQPFTSALVMSGAGSYRHNWVWDKRTISNPMQAKNQPLRQHEDVLVFSRGKVPYYPQKTDLHLTRKWRQAAQNEDAAAPARIGATGEVVGKYPKTIIPFNAAKFEGKTEHPTQKPVALFAYLIQTYTNSGETVLDFTAGSGTTAVAAEMTGRRWVCIEKEEKYCELIAKRLSARRN